MSIENENQSNPQPGFVSRHAAEEVVHGTNGRSTRLPQEPSPEILRRNAKEVQLTGEMLITNLNQLDEKAGREVATGVIQVFQKNGMYDLAEKLKTGDSRAHAPKGFGAWLGRVGNHRITVVDVVVFALAGSILWVVYEGVAYGLDLPRLGLWGKKSSR